MTLLVAIAALAATPRFVHLREPNADRIAVNALVRMPKLDPLGLAAADLLSKTVVGDNDRYSRAEMRALSAPGFEPRAWLMPDHMAISLSVYKADAAIGARMMAAMVSSAKLNADELDETHKRLRHLPPSNPFDREPRDWDILRRTDVVDIYRLAFRPEQMTIAFGGDVDLALLRSAWEEATTEWVPPRPRGLRPGRLLPEQGPTSTRTMIVRGKPIPPVDERVPVRILSMIGLGGGKGSALFCVARLENALSYRQELVLMPSREGFEPTLIIAPASTQESFVPELLELLDADIEKWSARELDRAKGYAGALLTYGADLNPFAFRPSGHLGTSLEDRTLLASYWEFKTEMAWEPAKLLEQMRAITLDEWKAEAREILGGFSKP